MPLSSEDLLRERRNRLSRLQQIIGDNEGEPKRFILARAKKTLGIRKSTAYDYYETLLDARDIVEVDGLVYTARTYGTRVQESLALEAEHEKQLTARITLDAFDTSEE